MNAGEEPRMDRRGAAETPARRGAFDNALRPASIEEALREGPRQFLALAAEVARVQFDPTVQWEAFVQALWEQVEAGFGLSPEDEEYPGVPRAWFDELDDPDVVIWDLRRGRARA